MAKKRVAILFGGRSGEHEVSITSAASVFNALDKNKYDVTLVGIDKQGRWLLPDESQVLASASNPRLLGLNNSKESVSFVPYETEKQLIALDAQKTPANLEAKGGSYDVIIPILHGTYGEDGTIQGLLELSQVPYVGSGVLGSALGMDKDASRRLLKAAGIPVVPTIVVRRHEFKANSEKIIKQIKQELGFPFFVKPCNAGSSVGVSKVKTEPGIASKMELAFNFDNKILIEKSIAARELECSVLGNNEPKASIVGEIIPQHEFYSYEAKYIDPNGALLAIPAKDISPAMSEKIRELSILAFQTLECSGLSRVDFFLDKNTNELYLNEINTMPGFTSISMYPKLWEASGLPYPKLLDELIRLAIERHEERRALRTTFEPE